MNATLKEGRCDYVMGVPDKYDLVLTARPYYRSTYVFVYPRGKGLTIASLDDPALKRMKIGVHLLGDDYTNPPPVHELSKRGIVDNVVGFSTFYSAENPPSAIIDAVANGRIDLAIVWGPVAGYFAGRQRVGLELVPFRPARATFRSRSISRWASSVAKPCARDQAVLDKRQAEITKILKDYGVPLLERTGKVR